MLLSRGHRRVIDRVQRVLRASGNQVEVAHTSAFEAGPSLSAELLASARPDAVFVCGGDGTVFDVVQSLAGTEIPVGVVPLGTGNILAQNLGFPHSPVKTAEALLRAVPHSIPLGRMTVTSKTADPVSWWFLTAAGVGAHAALLSAASRSHKHSIGKTAYWAAGMGILLRHRFEPFEIEVTDSAGAVTTAPVIEMIAVRVSDLNIWRPGGELRGNVLRLASLPPTSRGKMIAAAVRALLQRSYPVIAAAAREQTGAGVAVTYKDVQRVVCQPLRDFQYKEPLFVQADGEVIDAETVTIEMSEQAVNVLLPK